MRSTFGLLSDAGHKCRCERAAGEMDVKRVTAIENGLLVNSRFAYRRCPILISAG
jgi:hypothetical protein